MAERSWCRIEFAAKDREKVLKTLGCEPDEIGERFLELHESTGGGAGEQDALDGARICYIAKWDGYNGSYAAGIRYVNSRRGVSFATNDQSGYLPMVAVGENLTMDPHTLAAFVNDLRVARRVRSYIDNN